MKVPEPRKLNSGNYFIQLRLNGVSVPVTASTAKECKRQAELIKAEHRAGKRQIQAQTATLKQAMQAYIDKYETVLSPATIRGYDDILQHRFPNYMGKTIDAIDWQEMVNEELKTKSPKTVKNGWALVTASLKEKGMTPKVVLAKVPPTPPKFLTSAEILQFLKALEGKSFEIPALFALHGLRRSEIYALDWKQINLKSNDIYVSGAVVKDKNGNLVDKPTNKNKTSTRHVPIMIPRLAELLAAAPDKQGKIVTSNINNLYRNINKVCESCGLKEIGVHGLRKSITSLGLRVGMTTHDLMQLGGWSDYKTMHDTYIHVAAAEVKEKTDLITQFFEQAENKNQKNDNANEKC